MTRNIFIFLGTFVAGAFIALVVRVALFAPHADAAGTPAGGGNYAPMVANPLAPAKSGAHPNGHATPAAVAKAPEPRPAGANGAATVKTVNTVCAICGMPVDPKLPTVEYEGKTIGFGCKMCAPKFKADPDRYAPFYLRNEVIKN